MILSVGMAIRQRLRRQLFFIGLLIIVAGVVAASDPLPEKADEIILRTEGMISQAPLVGMLVFVLLAMLSAAITGYRRTAARVSYATNSWHQAESRSLVDTASNN